MTKDVYSNKTTGFVWKTKMLMRNKCTSIVFSAAGVKDTLDQGGNQR